MLNPALIRRLAAAALVVSGPAFAQSAGSTTAPSGAVPEAAEPSPKPTGSSGNLSEKLNQSNGVIHPKEVDPGIAKPAPRAGDPNVVPAPGSPGAAPAPEAK